MVAKIVSKNVSKSVSQRDSGVRASALKLAWLFVLTSIAAGLAVACAEGDGVETCQRTGDCTEVGFICVNGECQDRNVARACTERSQCLSNEECVNGFCGEPTGDTSGAIDDTSGGTTDATSDDSSSSGTDATDSDSSSSGVDSSSSGTDTSSGTDDIRDTIPPTITARLPDRDSQDVALDSEISITFSEALQPPSVTTPGNIYVWNHSTGQALPATITWDADNLQADITPQAPLQPFSPYEVTVTSNVIDMAGIGVQAESWFFYTEAAGPQAEYDALARAYAPEIHQDALSTSRDVPVRIDFDNDMLPRNNGASAGQGSGDPAVYYLVSETETHFFIQYALYYPSYKRADGSPVQTHSLNVLLVVVRKVETDPLGELQVVQTYSALDGRVDTFLPGCSGGAEPFCTTTVTGKPLTTGVHTIPAAEYATATDARRIPLYVQPDNHNICHFGKKDGNIGWCGRSGNDYIGTAHAVLTLHGDASARPPAPNFTQGTGTYALYSLNDWWMMRASIADDDDSFYLNATNFTATEDFHIGKGRTIRLPDSLNTPADQRDSTGRTSPFAINAQGTGKGRWSVDPAFVVQDLLNMPAPFAFFESKYCFNLLAGVDRTSDPLCD